MPVNIPETLPARDILQNENIFVMGESRAQHQDIRPLKLAILKLMPTKIATATQLLRLLGNSALQVDITLLHMESHESKNTTVDHPIEHYDSFEEVKDEKCSSRRTPRTSSSAMRISMSCCPRSG